MSNETINATVRFIEVGGKFIWKVYDEGGSVIAKAANMFANKEEAQADFEAFRTQAEAAPVVDTTAPVTPVDPDLNQNGLPESPADHVGDAADMAVDNQPVDTVDNPVETVDTAEAVIAEPGTETASEVAQEAAPAEGEVAGTAEGIAPAQV
jgi:hypothetical protein